MSVTNLSRLTQIWDDSTGRGWVRGRMRPGKTSMTRTICPAKVTSWKWVLVNAIFQKYQSAIHWARSTSRPALVMTNTPSVAILEELHRHRRLRCSYLQWYQDRPRCADIAFLGQLVDSTTGKKMFSSAKNYANYYLAAVMAGAISHPGILKVPFCGHIQH